MSFLSLMSCIYYITSVIIRCVEIWKRLVLIQKTKNINKIQINVAYVNSLILLKVIRVKTKAAPKHH